MLTIRAAARLLASADSLQSARSLAFEIGFIDPPAPLADESCHDLGIHDLVSSAQIVRGSGSMRLLVAMISSSNEGSSSARESTRSLCTKLVRHAPAQLWCVIMIHSHRDTVCIAAPGPGGRGVRIAALQVDRGRVTDSDAETVRSLAEVAEQQPVLRHARFVDILSRDAISGRFYTALDQAVKSLALTASGRASADERHELALLCSSRCLFLAFLEAKGWLDGDRNFLLRHSTSQLEAGGRLHERLLRPLFFGTLNTPSRHRAPASRKFGVVPFLNGGLFSPTRLERLRHTVRFSDDALVALIGDVLDRFRFTAREDSISWTEAAVDPEMLGRAFECLMESDERRRSGSYYTPPALVCQVVTDALESALHPMSGSMLRGILSDPDSASALCKHDMLRLRESITSLRALDPACGSGAFLVHLLEALSTLTHVAGDLRAPHSIRREVLTRSIFGVDRNPTAVWLCELRLWLSVVIECPETNGGSVPPLPNLDHNIRVGDTLAGGDFEFTPASGRSIASLRDRYTRASGSKKRTLGNQLDREERAKAVAETARRLVAVKHERRGMIESIRAEDLFGHRARRSAAQTRLLARAKAQQRTLDRLHQGLQLGAALPFRFAASFSDVASMGGFDLVVGNPPWVRPHSLSPDQRKLLRDEYSTFSSAAWTAGAQRAGAGNGFSAQADLSVAFVERGSRLLREGGTLALLLPAKLWRTLSGGGVRRLLSQELHVQRLRDWSDAPSLFNAAVYPSLVVAQRARVCNEKNAVKKSNAPHSRICLQPERTSIQVSVARHTDTANFAVEPDSVSYDSDPSSPWILLPPAVRTAFNKLQSSGTPLGDSHFGRPTLGVKCGCNAAFLLDVIELDDDLAKVQAANRTGTIERHLLKPLIRGEDILPAGCTRNAPESRGTKDRRILWTHDANGSPLQTLPPRALRWLNFWRRSLEARCDARANVPWWSLFRTESAKAQTPRVVWADIGKRLRTTVLHSGDPTVPLNTCYILRTSSDVDAQALDVFLTSSIAGAWLDTLAEPARGGFRRFLGWTVATVPVPAKWNLIKSELADIYALRASGALVNERELNDVILKGFGLVHDDVQPLLDWFGA